MIAAGEVVQRPASVVKELMENALDAGADSVDVSVTDSGRTLIKVIDNGCGMSPDDAVLCFERHATSKIAEASDLEHILTFGFRGEALASIAAVAEVTLRTRRASDEVGVEVEFAASDHLATREVAATCGTSVSVRNLFYNVPARRKFLKSDSVELRHVVDEFTRVALTRPDVSFSLRSNGRDVHLLKKAKSLKFRILDLLGQGVTGELVDISADTSVAAIRGFVGRPDTARKTLGNQFFFVNGRYFRSPYLHKAVMKAYESLIPEGVTPSYFIYLDVDPSTIDVNIHPTKTEIKFSDDSVIFSTVYAAVREALGRSAFSATLDFDNPEARDLPIVGKSFDDFTRAPEVKIDKDYNPFDDSFGESFGNDSTVGSYDPSRYVSKSQDYGALFEDNALNGKQLLVVSGRFILSRDAAGVKAVHVARARERVLYDRFMKALSVGAPVGRLSLFPVKLSIGDTAAALLEENAELLSSLAFDIVPFGGGTVVVNAVPEGFASDGAAVEKLVRDIVEVLSEEGTGALDETLRSALATRFARLGASGGILSQDEALALLDELASSSAPNFSPSGKKIVSIISVSEIEKWF